MRERERDRQTDRQTERETERERERERKYVQQEETAVDQVEKVLTAQI